MSHEPFISRCGRLKPGRSPEVNQPGIHYLATPQFLHELRRAVSHTRILDINQLPFLSLNYVTRLKVGHAIHAHELKIRAARQHFASNARAQHLAPGDRNYSPQISGYEADFDRRGDPYDVIGDRQQAWHLDLSHWTRS